ncbi:MAG: hypothetical protein LBD16_06375 [Oscillospiraceae bacterium]|jgi:membrane-bound serine protease (ClpP class)|nr:hypothetical protein [Oscillospiraceae bacterium]
MLDAIVYNLPIILCGIIGLGLVLLELFIPGFGVAGLSGIAMLGVSVWLTFTKHGVWPALLLFVLLTLLVSIFLSTIVKSAKNGRLANSPFFLSEQSVTADEAAPAFGSLVGKTGTALSTLRPAGIAEIDGARYNVVTDGEYIKQDAAITVTKSEGNRIVVAQKS